MQLTENLLTYKIPAGTGGQEFVDIAQGMSIVNRKLNRQQGLWTVLGVNVYAETVADAVGVGYDIEISGAPRTWVARNALVKGFEHWKEQQAEAYAASSPSIKPKWQDFKVFLNNDHRTSFVAGDDLLPTSGSMFGSSDPYIAGPDWVHSKIVFTDLDGGGLPTTHEPDLHIIGAGNGNTSVSLIRQYQISRARVFSPDPDVPSALTTSIYTLMDAGLSDKIEEVTQNLLDENDEPPYDVDDYPGGASNGTEPTLYTFGSNSSTFRRKISITGFAAPNGVVRINWAAMPVGGVAPVTQMWLQFIVGGRRKY